MVAVGPTVLIVAVICGTGEKVAVMGTSAPLRKPSCKVAAMMVAAWSSTERVGEVPGMLQASRVVIRMIEMNVSFCVRFIKCARGGVPAAEDDGRSNQRWDNFIETESITGKDEAMS